MNHGLIVESANTVLGLTLHRTLDTVGPWTPLPLPWLDPVAACGMTLPCPSAPQSDVWQHSTRSRHPQKPHTARAGTCRLLSQSCPKHRTVPEIRSSYGLGRSRSRSGLRPWPSWDKLMASFLFFLVKLFSWPHLLRHWTGYNHCS